MACVLLRYLVRTCSFRFRTNVHLYYAGTTGTLCQLFIDRNYILGYSDKGVQCACAHPCTVPGWSEYLRILGYSDRGGCSVLVPIHVLSWDGQSISGSWDTLTRKVGVIFSNKCCHENCLHNVHLKNGTASLDMCDDPMWRL